MNVAGSSSVEKLAFINKSQRSEKVKARVDEEGGEDGEHACGCG